MNHADAATDAICVGAIVWQAIAIGASAVLAHWKGWKPALGALLGLFCGVFAPVLILVIDMKRNERVFQIVSAAAPPENAE